MPMIDVYSASGTFSDKHALAKDNERWQADVILGAPEHHPKHDITTVPPGVCGSRT
jgi:hypothetical protein